jgi:hypothetical protein
MSSARDWAGPLSNTDRHADLGAYQESLPITLIATAREHFATCAMNESLAAVQGRYRDEQFDHLPVTDSEGVIVGILDLSAVPAVQSGERVDSHMHLLREAHLIGADSSILQFIRQAAEWPFRLVVSGNNISGLVSISDLQRLPVRAALFAMITHLEMLMADTIRAAHRDTDEWLVHLSKGRAKKIRSEISSAKHEDSYVDALLFTQFCDKRDILAGQPWLRSERSNWDSDMKQVERLRNALAHANEYAASPEAARRLCATVRTIDDWINRLTAHLASEPVGPTAR